MTESAPVAYLRLNPDPSQPTRWQKLSGVVETVEAWTLADVPAALAQVEARARSGLHAAGWVSYETAPAFEPALPVRPDPEFPPLWFALFAKAEAQEPASSSPFSLGEWQPLTLRAEYDAAIATIRQEIAAGNTYQVNYTLRLQTDFVGDDLAFFSQLAAAQPTPYSLYLDAGRYRILSVSPELFFRVQGGRLTTRPMKGTTSRGRFPSEDRQQAAWLRASVKDRAENVMIVDLLRNDLGRVAQFGSVQVPELCTVERYPTLWTMTSTVTARQREGVALPDLFAALFPCGSVTGAPKISTMRLIHALERQPRRVYCGALGYVAPSGDAVFNVPIRTVLIDRERQSAEYGVGGGITWDSRAAGEYDEVRTKARVLRLEQREFELLETLRLAEGTFKNGPDHVARLTDSAAYFGFPLNLADLAAELSRVGRTHPQGLWRVRLLVDQAGQVSSEAVPFDDQPRTVQAALAQTPVSSQEVWLFHKTTQRQSYTSRAAEVPAGSEALLHNERGELTEFVTGNLVVRLAGQLYTPPVDCGLLAGIERQHALANGEVSERILHVADLAQAEDIWHLNSLRGWRPVNLQY